MDEYTRITHKRHSSTNYNSDDNKKIKYFKNLITRILLSIILVISVCITIKINEHNAYLIKDYVFKDSLKFTQMNNWYQEKFGKLLPTNKENSNLVFSNNDISSNKYENYENGIKIEINKGNPVTILNGGIVVYIGEKDNYGNTVIIQGNDGVDYWYGNLDNISVNLYDYLEKNTLIGEAKENFIYLVLQKDGNFLNYEEFISKN